MLLLGVLALAFVIAALITLPVLAHRIMAGKEPEEHEGPEARRIRRESRKWWQWPHGGGW